MIAEDPAVETAAVALSLGISDPLDMLALDPFHWSVAVRVVNQAAHLRAERDRALVDALSQATANRTIAALGKSLRAR